MTDEPVVVDNRTQVKLTVPQIIGALVLLTGLIANFLSVQFRTQRNEEKIEEVHNELKEFRAEWLPKLHKE